MKFGLIRIVATSYNSKASSKVFIGDGSNQYRIRDDVFSLILKSPNSKIDLNKAVTPEMCEDENSMYNQPRTALSCMYDGKDVFAFIEGKEYVELNTSKDIKSKTLIKLPAHILDSLKVILEYQDETKSEYDDMVKYKPQAKSNPFGDGIFDDVEEEDAGDIPFN